MTTTLSAVALICFTVGLFLGRIRRKDPEYKEFLAWKRTISLTGVGPAGTYSRIVARWDELEAENRKLRERDSLRVTQPTTFTW